MDGDNRASHRGLNKIRGSAATLHRPGKRSTGAKDRRHTATKEQVPSYTSSSATKAIIWLPELLPISDLTMKQLFRSDPKQLIVVTQFQRADFDLGSEHEFDWGIAIIDSPSVSAAPTSLSYTYKALAEPHPTANRKVWRLELDRAAILGTFPKWRGGVIIGEVKRSLHEDLDRILTAVVPFPKFDGWNCRDWVIEAIDAMYVSRWIQIAIDSQEQLLPQLRDIHKESKEFMSNGGTAVVRWDREARMKAYPGMTFSD